MEAYNFLRKKYFIPPEKSLNEFSIPSLADWDSLVKLLEEYSCQIEPQVSFAEPSQLEAGWISLDEERPKEKIPFVAYDKNSCYPIVLAEWNLGEGFTMLGTQRSLKHITHWLKIPDPPKP